MKTILPLLCSLLLLQACNKFMISDDKLNAKIPYKSVPKEIALNMIDTFRANPSKYVRMLQMYQPSKQMKMILKSDKAIVGVRYILAAYLNVYPQPSSASNKYTLLLQVIRQQGGNFSFNYYDLQQPVQVLYIQKEKPMCPEPPCATNSEQPPQL